MTTIGDNLKRYRKAFGYSQHELSRMSGVHQPIISYVEAGHKEPKFATVRKLARALEVPISALVDEGPGGPPQPPKTPRTDEPAEDFDQRFAATGPVEADELREEIDAEYSELQSYVKSLRAAGAGTKDFTLRRARAKLRRAQERLSATTLRGLDLAGLAGEPKATVAEYIPSAEDTEKLLRMLFGEEAEQSRLFNGGIEAS